MALTLREEILKSLRASPIILRQLVRDLDDDDIRRQPEPGEWAIIEVIAHMADVDERALARVQRMLHEDHPTLPGYDQEALARERGYLTMRLDEQLARFEQISQAHVAALSALDDAAWERTGYHEAQGEITITLYEEHVASEDVDHLAQIARLIVC